MLVDVIKQASVKLSLYDSESEKIFYMRYNTRK